MSVKMVSPVVGTAGSPYGRRGLGVHLGLDIPGGGKSRDVVAAFSGKIVEIVRGVKHGSLVSSSPNWARGRTPNLIIIENPDGEFQLYGHVDTDDRWKIGDKVDAGDYLGKTDLSGNTTGYHLHFEIWSSRHTTRNPAIDFRYFGVGIGSVPKGVDMNPWKKAPSAPVKKPSTGGSSSAKEPHDNVKKALKAMGLAPTAAGVKAYQSAHGLVADGDWGDVTSDFYHSVKARQAYVNEWKRVQQRGLTLKVDGYWGKRSKSAELVAKSGATRSFPYKPPAFAKKR